jgi:hypothetical protein
MFVIDIINIMIGQEKLSSHVRPEEHAALGKQLTDLRAKHREFATLLQQLQVLPSSHC